MNTDSISVNVFLWGVFIGKLSWDSSAMRSVFSFSEEYMDAPFDISPATFSKQRLRQKSFFGSKKTEGLPEFLADSLPDDWGNLLFDKWTKDNHIPLNEMRSLLKLSFIGKRGMGAFEFVPDMEVSTPGDSIDLASLYDVAMAVICDREKQKLDSLNNASLQQLITLGTSAGGKHAKGVIAINDKKEVRSGQIDLPEEYRYYLLKFNEDPRVPICEIEHIYYEMALDAGIEMMHSELLPIGGRNHFLTERFDRLPGGRKIHVQSLRALNPHADDYTHLFWLCDSLKVQEEQKEQLFRRMVFNFVAGVSDDHNRNFSFLMTSNGEWSLAPAYDVMFTSNIWENPSAISHSLGMWQKRSHITLDDIISFVDDYDIPDVKSTVRSICQVVETFPDRCSLAGIQGEWTDRIWAVLKSLLL
ncbi:MAG: type II toxin-antitoxin system HipA family toxin [Bacteroidales bacterium]|nr:type II toxin-antitoxin system HipA family toxin [Bacteroidales bacterium]